MCELARAKLAGAKYLSFLRELVPLDQAADRVGPAQVRALPDPVAAGELKARSLQVPVDGDLEVDSDSGRFQALDEAGESTGVRASGIDVRAKHDELPFPLPPHGAMGVETRLVPVSREDRFETQVPLEAPHDLHHPVTLKLVGDDLAV